MLNIWLSLLDSSLVIRAVLYSFAKDLGNSQSKRVEKEFFFYFPRLVAVHAKTLTILTFKNVLKVDEEGMRSGVGNPWARLYCSHKHFELCSVPCEGIWAQRWASPNRTRRTSIVLGGSLSIHGRYGPSHVILYLSRNIRWFHLMAHNFLETGMWLDRSLPEHHTIHLLPASWFTYCLSTHRCHFNFKSYFHSFAHMRTFWTLSLMPQGHFFSVFTNPFTSDLPIL